MLLKNKNLGINHFCCFDYSNHLNTEHLNTENLNTSQYGCPVFKWQSHVTWQTIPTCLTINRLFSVRFSDHHSNTGPFMTSIVIPYKDGFKQVLLQIDSRVEIHITD